jgi:hypothetical protein
MRLLGTERPDFSSSFERHSTKVTAKVTVVFMIASLDHSSSTGCIIRPFFFHEIVVKWKNYLDMARELHCTSVPQLLQTQGE